MNKITLFSTICATALVLSLTGCNQKNQSAVDNNESIETAERANDSTFTDRTEEKDADFIVNAVSSYIAEIKIAQLAKNKAASADVKKMAATLEEQHLKILNGLRAYADSKGIAIPLDESDKDVKQMNDLAEQSGEKFDKQWCDAMEDRHEKSIKKFESRRDKTEDPALREWIIATLPGLKDHLAMLENHDKSPDGE